MDDYASVQIDRGRKVHEFVRLGPNQVHAIIQHPDGSIEDLGTSENLLTNIGRDMLAELMGGRIPSGGVGSPATATSATSLTATGTPWTASNLATPQLGIVGTRIYASVTGITTPPVYGNVISNTTSVATIDQWWTAADGTGTTPASTNAFILGAGGGPAYRFMGLTTDSGAASAADTALASEITTNGGNRQLGTYAHTYGASTYTVTKAFAITGTLTAIHKGGLFSHNSQTGVGPVVFETVLNQDATVGNGDTLTVTWTVTLSG
jgi:hypothetical protein